MTRTVTSITDPDPVRQSLWCHLREKDGRIVRYCFMATSRITEPGVERC
ncbi:MAG TPA: hypothetical protein VNW96_09460 [Mycobacterium sp.]|nr:hypothetical protein [Mycobacterium sp.]